MNDQPSLDERIALLTSLLVDPSEGLRPSARLAHAYPGGGAGHTHRLARP